MATSAYRAWVNAGKPWRKAKPIAELEALAHLWAIPVLGTLGDEAHLTADRPKDHTPFSFTAWPVPLPGYVVTAIDLADVDRLGQKILDLARSGETPWLKYINFENGSWSHSDGFTEPVWNKDTHVHISIRSDWCDRSIGAFDPWGDDMELSDLVPSAKTDVARTVDQVLGDLWRGVHIRLTEWMAKVDARLDAIAAAVGQPGSPTRTPTKVVVTGEVVEWE